ncbi:hypothetical protein EON65_26360 [archaeon]|nr:MAG: hypothetical protein EON65_26360 [archaeon]
MSKPREVSIPEQRVFEKTQEVFPLLLSSPEGPDTITFNLATWLHSNRDELDRLLLKHRGIVFRGFSSMNDHNDFQSFVEATGVCI